MMRSVAGVLLVGLIVLTGWLGRVDAQGAKAPDIKEVMSKLNKPTGIYFAMVRELREQEPDWAELKQNAQVLSKLSAGLARATPPKGDAASWNSLVKVYVENAKAADAAVQKMDKAAAVVALTKMGEPTCKNCHKVHRPN